MAEKKNGSDIGAAAAGGAGGAAAGVLSAVGGIVGGGMFAGLCIVAAAPIVGAAVGYGLYKWIKKK